MRVKVPFSFVLAGKEFSAGEYRVNENSNGLVIVQGAGHAAVVVTTPAESKPGCHWTPFHHSQRPRISPGWRRSGGEVGRAMRGDTFQARKLTIATR